jgi:hypothetical protein
MFNHVKKNLSKQAKINNVSQYILLRLETRFLCRRTDFYF